MSRSYRKNLVFPICRCNTQKKCKTQYNRTFRTNSKKQLYKYLTNISEDYKYESVYKRPYADIWLSPSDGRWWLEMFKPDDFLEHRLDYVFVPYKTYKEYMDNFKRKFLSK
jgi:hypothetical protein